jgi:Adenylate and Guanylate cyclase catalytic domain
LNELVQATEQFRLSGKKNKLLRLATGDGMALVFRDSPESPVRCALELGSALRKEDPPLPVRMGIHSGLVHGVTDVNNRLNVAGAGINLAQRVMDCGDAGHILLSKHVAEDLEHHARWCPLLHELGECEVKHGLRLTIVSLYDTEAGNAKLPDAIRRQRKKRGAATAALVTMAGALAVTLISGSWWLVKRNSESGSVTQTASETPSLTIASTPAIASSPADTAAPAFTFAQTSLTTDSNLPAKISPSWQSQRLFAGTWRGRVHNTGPKGTRDLPIEFTIDPSETRWSNLNMAGQVTRRGRTLNYTRSYNLGKSTNVQVSAELTVNPDGKSASYNKSQLSVTGKARSQSFVTGTLEKVE